MYTEFVGQVRPQVLLCMWGKSQARPSVNTVRRGVERTKQLPICPGSASWLDRLRAMIRHGQGSELDSLPGHSSAALKSVVTFILVLTQADLSPSSKFPD